MPAIDQVRGGLCFAVGNLFSRSLSSGKATSLATETFGVGSFLPYPGQISQNDD